MFWHSHFIPLFNINSIKSWMMKPKLVLSHDFLSVHHEYFVGTLSASILLCPPHFQISGYATVREDQTLFLSTHWERMPDFIIAVALDDLDAAIKMFLSERAVHGCSRAFSELALKYLWNEIFSLLFVTGKYANLRISVLKYCWSKNNH